MRLFAVLGMLSLSSIAGCLLADAKDAPKCDKGFHPELQKCVPDTVSQNVVKISAAEGGTSCTGDPSTQRPPVLAPETLTVKAGDMFQFENGDAVDHEVRGADGKVWITVRAGQLSEMMSITKVGTWPYHVSGCAKAGSVTVQ